MERVPFDCGRGPLWERVLLWLRRTSLFTCGNATFACGKGSFLLVKIRCFLLVVGMAFAVGKTSLLLVERLPID